MHSWVPLIQLAGTGVLCFEGVNAGTEFVQHGHRAVRLQLLNSTSENSSYNTFLKW